jgi:probable rRNA maturation factor
MISLEVSDNLVPASARLGAERYLAIAAAVNAAMPNLIDGVININYIADEEIQRLNRMYRGVDKVTDVLSFASGIPEQSGEVGDVLISYDQAARQAVAASGAIDGGDVELECADLVVHGILHCLGYDHELPEDAEEMFPLQDSIVARIL